MHPDCTILVTSCDAYRDVDGPFLRLWRRYWPDCPFELVLLTETPFENPGWAGERFDRVITAGTGKTWSETVVTALNAISTPYVMLIMGDFLLDAPVDTARISALLELAVDSRAHCLRLVPRPPALQALGLRSWDGGRVVEYPRNRAYSASCQAGFWNRETLLAFARRTKSAWEFERYASFMFDLSDDRPVMMTVKKEFPCLDAVHKGYWETWGVAALARERIDYDFTRRGLPPLRVRVREAVKRFVFNLSPHWVTRIQNVFNLGAK